MKIASVRIAELRKEIANLAAMYDEAKAEYITADDQAVYYRNKAEVAEKQMNDLADEISYRLAEINELEEWEAEQHERATA